MPWEEEVAEARAELEVAKARRELEALNRMAREKAEEAARLAREKAEEAARLVEAEQGRRKMEQRLEEFKSFGRDLAVDLPIDARMRVVALLEEFVTSQRFPSAMSNQEAYTFIRDRVDRVRAEVEKAREQAREAERASLQQQLEDSGRKAKVDELIRLGCMVASTETIGWSFLDRQRALQEIERELRAEVRWNWTEDEVREFVKDVFDEWEDDEEGEDQETANDPGDQDEDGGSEEDTEDAEDEDDW